MSQRGMHLAWVVVNDFKSALKFYTDVMGLKVRSVNEEFGWAELSGDTGALLGIAQKSDHSEIQPGQNAIVTLTVDDIAKETKQFTSKGAQLIGSMIEVPGHVKMQSFTDPDGNLFQLVESLETR